VAARVTRGAQHLSAMREHMTDELRKGAWLSDGDFSRWEWSQVEYDGFDLRAGPEGLRRNRKKRARLGERVGHDRQRTVIFLAGAGQKPVGDFLLNGADEALESGLAEQRLDEKRCGDLVGQVGDECVPATWLRLFRLKGRSDLGVESVLAGKNVGVDESEPGILAEALLDDARKSAVDFDCHHACAGFQQHFRERAGAAAHLQHDVRRLKVCGGDELSHKIQVDKKVLAVSLARPEAGGGKQGANLAEGLTGHTQHRAVSAARVQGAPPAPG